MADQQAEPFTVPPPSSEHQWLRQLVGEWTYEAEGFMPGQPPSRSTGSERVRSLGDLWIVGNGRMEEFETLLTIGFDPARGRFVGSWVGSMMSHFWVYDGELDRERNTLHLYAEGPALDGSGGGTAHYRDSYQVLGADERLLTGSVQQPDGQWLTFMAARYTRQK